jgi:transposase
MRDDRKRDKQQEEARRVVVRQQPPLPLTNYTLSTECPACGAPTFRHACKVRCPRCGFAWNCSEL